ncbi:MAG TPA: phosphoribosylglycinamide formyltransferase [Candidatus Cloacimonas sp.]|jgi:phosphoribosylglycinamide formyltransferase-1|nr:phosphoribosylglycinamide formyltransferase [Candidatus Cloacimonas sp.]HQM16558.1 phosphoribosylglycinamide formyltransferase [Candidatus Cloacimonas sp.]HRQ99941.1 phosphoribosylglycinamide formyltransferase [Candidatus Cloacimonas sp.]HRR50764.1 phosphoribosylglycinamide formyltransferase [Candidatus Cloacimonas sp.]
MERTTSGTHKVAVFCSGLSRGSNLCAIYKYFADNKLPIEIALVIFTCKDAPAIQLAEERNLNYQIIQARDMQNFEKRAMELCRQHSIELIALSGFLKQLSPNFIESMQIPILNIHPALLPKYGGKGMYGMAVHNSVFAAGEKESGVTIHLVNSQYDNGKIVAQEKVDISACKSPEEIAQKVLDIEHKLYARTIKEYLLDH